MKTQGVVGHGDCVCQPDRHETFHYLGHFDTATAAAIAYDAKAREIFGEETKLNFSIIHSRDMTQLVRSPMTDDSTSEHSPSLEPNTSDERVPV